MLWRLITLGLVLLMAIMLASEMKVQVMQVYQAGHRLIRFKCRLLFGIIRFQYVKKKQTPASLTDLLDGNYQMTKSVQKKAKDFVQVAHLIIDHQAWLRKTLARIQCMHVRWYTEIGTGDASSTAQLSGIIWGLKSTLLGFASHRVRFKTMPILDVTPHFNTSVFRTELTFDVSARLSVMLAALLKLLWQKRRERGGVTGWLRRLLRVYRNISTT